MSRFEPEGGTPREPTTGGEGPTGDPHKTHTDNELVVRTWRILEGGRWVLVLHVEYAEQRLKYGILFIFSPVYEYSNLAHEHVPV